jgi:hypothetical protein
LERCTKTLKAGELETNPKESRCAASHRAPNAAEAKINAARKQQDRWSRNQSEACSDAPLFWERAIEVAKRGAALLSVFVSGSAHCGGVHPYNEFFPFVYDLRTGRAVK